MASVKLVTLAIRTIAKPISARLKHEAQQHASFRRVCTEIAQRMYRYEMKLGTFVLGQPPRAIKPLSESRAIDNGANFLAETFLFSVAAALILAETYRSSARESKRRDRVAEQLDGLAARVAGLHRALARAEADFGARMLEERTRTDEISRVLQQIVEIGLRGSWVEFQDTPLRVPMIGPSSFVPSSMQHEEEPGPSPTLSPASPSSSSSSSSSPPDRTSPPPLSPPPSPPPDNPETTRVK